MALDGDVRREAMYEHGLATNLAMSDKPQALGELLERREEGEAPQVSSQLLAPKKKREEVADG